MAIRKWLAHVRVRVNRPGLLLRLGQLRQQILPKDEPK
jgi:hypothetical protein